MVRPAGKKTNLYRELVQFPEIFAYLKGSAPLQGLFELLPNLSQERKEEYRRTYEGIGNTPVSIIPLTHSNRVFVKRECDNAMGNNHYSRYWMIHLALAEAFGLITRGETTILEITSGSSGISLSMACEALGYQLKIIIPENLPYGRVSAMTRACTTIVKVPGYIGECRNYFMVEKDRGAYYLPNHSEEKADLISSVFSRISHEFIQEYGPVDNVLLGLGNGSSTYGVAKVFKAVNPAGRVYSFYPSNSAGKIVYGLYADNLSFRHISLTEKERLIDGALFIDDIPLEEVRSLYDNTPIVRQWGHSSLYALYLAAKMAESRCGETFFSIAYDKIERYED